MVSLSDLFGSSPAEDEVENDFVSEDDDYLDDLLPEDPKPSWVAQDVEETEKPGKSKQVKVKAPAPKTFTKKQREDIKDQLIFMISIPNMAFAMRDPVCSSAIDENLENIIDKLLPIINRNPNLYKMFMNVDKASNFMDYVALSMAVMPIVATIKEHHFTKHDHDEEEVLDELQETFFSPA